MKSVRTAIRVFEAVAEHQPVGLSELSRRLEVPKPSVQRALATLAQAGWLRRDVAEPGRWVVTARFAVLADVSPATLAAREAARPHVEALRAATGLTVGLFVLDGDHMAVVAGLTGPAVVRAVEMTLGPLPVHVSAAGRAILSRLPMATRREVLDRALRAYTEASLTDPEAVLAEVARAEARGFAAVRGEFQSHVTAVAAAVLDRHGLPLAAVTAFASGNPAATDAAAAAAPGWDEAAIDALGSAVAACARAVSDDLVVAARRE